MSKVKKEHKKGFLTAKLTFFDWGWRDNVVYSARAKQGEKEKGLSMLERLRDFFGVNSFDEEEFRKRMIEIERKAFEPTEYSKGEKPIKWTRDERGELTSPFSKKAQKDKES